MQASCREWLQHLAFVYSLQTLLSTTGSDQATLEALWLMLQTAASLASLRSARSAPVLIVAFKFANMGAPRSPRCAWLARRPFVLVVSLFWHHFPYCF